MQASREDHRVRLAGCLLAAGLLAATTGWAQPAEPAAERARAQTQERIYGWQLMIPAEREAFHARMRNATTAEERARIRAEHHAQMQVRAREQGVTLPDAPAPRGQGQGAGPGKAKGGQGQGPAAGPRGPGRGPAAGPRGPRQGKGPNR